MKATAFSSLKRFLGHPNSNPGRGKQDIRPHGRFKRFLAYLGTKLSRQAIYRFEGIVNHLKLGLWLSDHNFRFPQIVKSRDEVFRIVADQVRERRVLYLEFGVYKGRGMRFWSNELKHPESKLHGFDSFEGLPEDFGPLSKGTFTTGGRVPQIDDSRVQFFQGWFHETLPNYTVPDHDILILNLDADLYSSTIYVLRHLQPWIVPGSFVYLDDMTTPDHEGKAFHEFMSETGRKFRPICADRSLGCEFYECIG
jgi:hypothetical protein